MIQALVPTGLRGRLILAFTGLILLSVFMASGATLALHARTQVEQGQRQMAVQAITLANMMAETEAAATDEDPPRFLDMVRLILADARLRRGGQPLLLTDSIGRPIFSLNLPPDEDPRRDGRSARGAESPEGRIDRGDSRPPGELRRPPSESTAAREGAPGSSGRPGGGARFGFGFGRPSLRNPIIPAHVSPELRFAPPGLSPAGEPAIASLRTESGSELLYTAVTLPPAIEPERWMYFGRIEPLEPPLQLVIIRPGAELRGLWRPLLPSVALVGTLAVALATLLAIVVARSVTRPLEALTDASEQMQAGDYSVRVDAEGADEIEVLASAFNGMVHAVGEADRRQREFVANVSHDLRTPLTSVRGFANALLDGTAERPEQRQRAIEAIDSSSARMSDLIEALLKLARLEGQSDGMRMVDTAVDDLIDRSVETYQHLADSKGLEISIDAASAGTVSIDPTWMSSALGNVIDNAIRHSPDGGKLSIVARASAGGAQPTQLDDRLESNRANVIISVTDEGPGIAPEDRSKVFERFYRADPSRKAGGSGLGLAIVKEIVHAHNGRIEIESAEGAGTRVIIELPRGPERQLPRASIGR